MSPRRRWEISNGAVLTIIALLIVFGGGMSLLATCGVGR